MIEIWTEDSTAGYRFLKEINKFEYAGQLSIIPHNGVGENTPTRTAKYGGILYHLKKHHGNNLVLLYIDKAIDIQDSAENYANVIREVRKHKNVKIIEQTCFELGVLSYKKLFQISGNTDNSLKQIVQEFVTLSEDLSKFRPPYFSTLLKNYIKSRCGRKKQYEHISKMLLSDVTNIDTMYDGKHHYFSRINGSTVGTCWLRDCCIIPYIYQCSKKCTLPYMTLHDKINDLVTDSLIQNVKEQIDDFINDYLCATYQPSPSESKYESAYFAKYGASLKLIHICKILDTYTYWNYERLYHI